MPKSVLKVKTEFFLWTKIPEARCISEDQGHSSSRSLAIDAKYRYQCRRTSSKEQKKEPSHHDPGYPDDHRHHRSQAPLHTGAATSHPIANPQPSSIINGSQDAFA